MFHRARTDDELRVYLLENSKAASGTGCFEWLGNKTRGYGKISRQNKLWSTHRLSYFLFKDTDIDGFIICHHCDNPSCVNPNHLFKGTTIDNVKDKIKKGRARNQNTGKTHCKYGHEFTKENTYIQVGAGRKCKICRNMTSKIIQERKRKIKKQGTNPS